MTTPAPPRTTAASRTRRRRPQTFSLEKTSAPAGIPPSRWARWKRELLSSFGLAPTFRAYLFVGAILAILAFLLYNESIIRGLKAQEKRNVDLYARLISLASQAPDEQSIAIFQEISINPSINFPIIVTDHQGNITGWNGIELPANVKSSSWVSWLWRRLSFWQGDSAPAPQDTTMATMAFLRQLVQEMDAKNSPIPFFPVPEVTGRLYHDHEYLIVTDSQGAIVGWRTPGMSVLPDAMAPGRDYLKEQVRRLEEESNPLSFKAPVGALSRVFGQDGDIIIVDQDGRLLAWRGPHLPPRTAAPPAMEGSFAEQVRRLEKTPPLSFEIPAKNYIHYGDSELIRRISRATWVQISALLLFILVGYIGFRNIKRSEQRSIWVGMARETAHQLGTPLSSLNGWLELIEHELEKNRSTLQPGVLAQLEEMTGEMQKDMQRLTQIASRFSQIGSMPELQRNDVVAILQETIAYFERRGLQSGRYRLGVVVEDEIPWLPLNRELMGWVFENLIKNAIDAIDSPAGAIEIRVTQRPDKRAVRLTFQDNGRGIEPENLGRLFDPGFSTKKRGWGLGLTLVKRIVEEYHGGRIGILESSPGAGTTFEVLLPVGNSGEQRR